MIFFEDTEITQENKALLAQDLAGRSIWVTLKDPDLLAPFPLISEESKALWTNNDGELFLHCDLIEKISGSRNQYEAVLLENGGQIKTWGRATINDTWSIWDDYSDSIFIDLFGFSTIPMFRTDKYFGEQFELRIFRKNDVTALKAKFELFEGARLYNTLKANEGRIADYKRMLAHQESIIEKIEEIKMDHPEFYSEITYWKEKDTQAAIAELRLKIYGNESATINLEEYWFRNIIPQIKLYGFEISMDPIYLINGKRTESNHLAHGDIAIKIGYSHDEDHVQLKLVRMEESDYSDKLTEQTICEYRAILKKKRFTYKFDD